MIQKIKNFSSIAPTLRKYFEAVYADPRRSPSTRFCWDPWYVEGQYSHLRTPAWTFFPKKEYLKLHTQIVEWGRKNLGCWDISPPWLSLYLDGHFQNAHADRPHGPLAFVLSLSFAKNFQGGSTFVLKKERSSAPKSALFEKDYFF